MSAYCVELCQKFEVGRVHELTWAHSVNDIAALEKALSSDVNMIEADIMVGSYIPGKDEENFSQWMIRCASTRDKQEDNQVIMSHFPSTSSNLTLEMFLKRVIAFNQKVDPEMRGKKISMQRQSSVIQDLNDELEFDEGESGESNFDSFPFDSDGGVRESSGAFQAKRKPKGIKLDFKDINSVKPAIDLLVKLNVSANVVAVWLNGDVAKGPGCPPVSHLDGRKFLKLCCKVPEVVLSLGWLSSELAMTQRYTTDMINDMMELVQQPYLRGKSGVKYTVAAVAQHITFCVQAQFALASRAKLERLLSMVPNSSLTAFTGVGTFGVMPEMMVEIEDNFDTTRLFVDVYTKPVATTSDSLGKPPGCAVM